MDLLADHRKCQLCAQMNLTLSTESHWKVLIREYGNTEDLEDSEKTGCALCHAIAEAYRKEYASFEAMHKLTQRPGQLNHEKIQVFHQLPYLGLEGHIQFIYSYRYINEKGLVGEYSFWGYVGGFVASGKVQ